MGLQMGLYESIPVTADLLAQTDDEGRDLDNPLQVLERETLTSRLKSSQPSHNKQHLFGPKKEIKLQAP